MASGSLVKTGRVPLMDLSSTTGYPQGMPKVMVSFPVDLLEDVDQEASRRGSSRSALLAVAARRELQQSDPVEVEAALSRVRAVMRATGSFEAADLVRAERAR